jgi:alkylation response protein AidB-like acyl-CoA dehydrogenase
VRTAYPPTSTVTFHDNWNVSGLRGSGSGDYEVAAQFIEEDYIYTLDKSRHRTDAQFLWGYWGITYIFHIGFGLGVLKRALAEISKIVDGKARGAVPSLGEYEPFLAEYARNEALYQAVRSYAYSLVSQVEADVDATRELSEINRTRLGQLAIWLHQIGGDIFGFAYQWAGSQPLRESSALGRAFRDFRVAQNHLVVDPTWYPDFARTIIKTWRE